MFLNVKILDHINPHNLFNETIKTLMESVNTDSNDR